MVLLDPVAQVSTFPDRDRFQPAPGTILQSICRVAGSDRSLLSNVIESSSIVDLCPAMTAVVCRLAAFTSRRILIQGSGAHAELSPSSNLTVVPPHKKNNNRNAEACVAALHAYLSGGAGQHARQAGSFQKLLVDPGSQGRDERRQSTVGLSS
ncbi:hypothetical protein NKL07_02000 [Mesorhizobium sp. C280B]|uniref:hypothetical protein n=1 Tax=unclassified Mesorhizobium TaxID=325217 RepID=UPI0012EB4DC3|nr:hypothetical protein [Mesorhizobium sp. LSJC280B00]